MFPYNTFLILFQVDKIHILVENALDFDFIKAQNLREDWKLNFHFLGRRMRYKDAFHYASSNLLRRNHHHHHHLFAFIFTRKFLKEK